ncbi:nitrate- and nitrite sensing domain-containing protein [Parafrankia sp. BMG5.11]|uniref:sensor histidine kinase n=1 Tax=Parafrankia sp. BMG5.11 TaxID=222540 RepID=UPI00103BC52E|nr:nitrate- and nitrite sensing domain-containing protein [Parafrankia sp. BMG5.11]TCJ34498.1 histidine kinase [Parafrankia sp. BMG5.11]
MRNWPIRYKITLVLLLPLLALVGFGSWVVTGQLAAQRASDQTRTAARFLIHVNDLVYALQAERYAVSSLVGSGYREREFAARSTSARSPVDEALATVTETADELPAGPRNQVRDAVGAARNQMAGLATVRAGVDAQTLQPGPGTVTFNQMISSWLDVGAAMVGIGSEDTEVVRGATALSAVSRASEAISQQYGYVSAAAVLGGAVPDSATRVQSAIGAEAAWMTQFRSSATPEQLALYDSVVGPTLNPVTDLRDRVLRGERIDFTAWATASGAKSEQLRKVQRQVVDDLEHRSASLADAALRSALLSGLLAAGVVALSIAVSVGVATRLVGALRALRSGALEVAQRRLPAVTSKLRQGHPIDPAAEPPAFATAAGDEIGDVARAFNVTYSSAVSAAYEVAESRSVGAILQTLARRTQGLIQRQLRLIDELERDQQDGEILTRLFGVDHQATRMRRLAESLIVLAGGQPGRTFRGPVRLVQVLRAAASEVEDYTRVHVHLPTSDVEIVGSAVGDLTHMLAELIENATAFSPPDTPVTVQASRVGQGWTVEIEDRGVGLDPASYASTNHRMANPPPFEASTQGSQIGLFVVARLAARHRIAVRFKPSVYGGVHVVTIIPAGLIHTEIPHQAASLPAAGSNGGRQPAALAAGGSVYGGGAGGGSGTGPGAPGDRGGRRAGPTPAEELALAGAVAAVPHRASARLRPEAADDVRPGGGDARPGEVRPGEARSGGSDDRFGGQHGDPRGAGYGEDPRAAGYGEDPRAVGYGEDPRPAGYGEDPRAAAYGSDPRDPRDPRDPHDGRDGGYGAEARQAGYGGDARDNGYRGDPGGSGYQDDPRTGGPGSDTGAGRYGDDPRATGYGPDSRAGRYGDARAAGGHGGDLADRQLEDPRGLRLDRGFDGGLDDGLDGGLGRGFVDGGLDAAPRRRPEGRPGGMAAHSAADLADGGLFDPLFGPLRGHDGAEALAGPPGPGGHPRLEDLPRRQRGAHLAKSLRDDPAGERLPQKAASAPDPEAARALAQRFTTAFDRGMRDADDLDGR